MKLGRWIVLTLIAFLVSCSLGYYQVHQDSGTLLVSQPAVQSIGTDLTPHHAPALSSPTSDQTPDSKTWVLEFPKHWVSNGDCQIQGTLKTLLVQDGNHLSGHLHWVWNRRNDVAEFSGQISDRSVRLQMIPPAIGGFPITFNGRVTSAGTMAGKTSAKAICKSKDGPFTLTPIGVPQRSPQAQVLPLFQKPFDGEFLISNYFDHDVPQQFSDDNGYMTTWRGDRLTLGEPGAGIDGHGGYDWGLPENTPLQAVADGVVTFAGEGRPFFCPPLQQQTTGNYVYILHKAPSGEQFETEYVHLSRVDVSEGDRVKAGQPIGLSGNTGCSTGPHLHFGVRRIDADTGERTLVDPYGWDSARTDPWSTHPAGHESIWLWKKDQAPTLYEYGR